MLQGNNQGNLIVDSHHIVGATHTMDITVIHTAIASIKHGVYTAEEDFYHTVLPTKESILTCSCIQGSSLTLNHDNLNIHEQGALLFKEKAVPYEHIMKTAKDKRGEFLEIAVNKTFVTNLFEEEKEYLEELLGSQSSKLIFDLNLNTLQVLQQLISNPYQGKLAEHYINNKVEEAHLLQYHNWSYNRPHKELSLHRKDEQALHEIKSYITDNYNKDFTIQELALRVGINQTKLKKGFKTLFGTTTFKYIHDLRMQKALEMIKSREYNIYEIAEYVGYKHSHHFSTAFKKYYGQLPTKIKI
ncbi:helix-turn-helix transcriptional regulator [Myroides odoratimimus]|uniref:AraC family transcriptional regulator n=1 Tax=Myroides odoratimimus TaxID=76832 RepID=A0AAI8C507_9FLAO|nr:MULTISPECIES: AraC family transcriptional regulator [Myroides]ALU26763.1 AraC family transcriptional regulator [Myroides odoratimimus]APA92783.1 AraC family transcriptional regulator [Myroides sp. ZB35]MDM1035254.1 helix-turn-helix transcriptional regulator [Myroides odoratimimus]MDM1037091.1 helix-turn-helix transcriptional regulator [Myroides odoratimimus]MDM1051277.1 helix-turn-helix transcriptional regulator [Myroides odoratimimus]